MEQRPKGEGLALGPEQAGLWARVQELWQLAQHQDAAAIRAALHPHYRGWSPQTAAPHDREFALRSVTGPERILDYRLQPLAVQVYDQRVGVAHYTYRAAVSAPHQARREVTGRWTEVYLWQDGAWTLISVHGGPDA